MRGKLKSVSFTFGAISCEFVLCHFIWDANEHVNILYSFCIWGSLYSGVDLVNGDFTCVIFVYFVFIFLYYLFVSFVYSEFVRLLYILLEFLISFLI